MSLIPMFNEPDIIELIGGVEGGRLRELHRAIDSTTDWTERATMQQEAREIVVKFLADRRSRGMS